MPDDNVSLNLEELKKLLDEGVFDNFKNQKEGDYFEAKQQKPYEIDSPDSSQRFSAIVKLASDITSLANGKGGYIVCGLQTQKLQDSPHDVVIDLDLLKKEDFYDQNTTQALIIDSIHPRLEVQIDWYPSSGDSQLGVGVIFIPPQDESKKNFIVKVAEVDGNKLTRNFVGIPIRQGSDTLWMPVDQIYKLTKRGPNDFQQLNESLSGQIQELKDMLASGTATSTPADDLDRKIEEVLDVH